MMYSTSWATSMRATAQLMSKYIRTIRPTQTTTMILSRIWILVFREEMFFTL